ncbi:hypothetical protein BMQ_pBM60032 (plasmid) [Priestia megaterium QM B1551]|uniref:Uncharacterized protein n=1 Tax=Priestia megaterium (strain ATCC 12872 / QMB1551) TaxID=545693 RepID=D5E3T9_PRIM1|nr:hypothetical protein BMQ_pBM60032 [Priestia megaterium QM B1551]
MLLTSKLAAFLGYENLIVLDIIRGIHEMVLMSGRYTKSLENFILLFFMIGMETLSNRLWLLINGQTIRLKRLSFIFLKKGVTTTKIAHLMEHI